MIKISYLREFVLLAETLNFSKTAEKSYITQPALSRHLALLEDEMGATLMERTTRKVSLTPAGKTVYEAFRYMLEIYSQTQEKAHELSAQSRGRLVVNSPYYWTGDFTEPLIRLFQAQYPECEITIQSCQPIDGFDGLKKGLCDIFISMEMPEVSPIMNKIAISREEVRAFMPDTYLLCKKECVDYTDLNGQKYLYLKGFEYWKDRILQELLAEQIYPSAIIPCDQVEELGMRLQRENAVALLPYCIRHMNRSYIVSRPLKKPFWVEMYVYYEQNTKNPAVSAFVDLFCTEKE